MGRLSLIQMMMTIPNLKMSRSTEYVISSDGPDNDMKPRSNGIVHMWEFLLELLADENCKSLITWSRKSYGEFKFKKPEEVAARWGLLKHKPGMSYKKFCRSLRCYYDQEIIKKVPGQRLVYKFHKLPSEYIPRKTRSADSKVNEQTLPTSGLGEDENRFKTLSRCRKECIDESGEPLIDKEKFKIFLQERLTQRMKKITPTEQTKEVPTPAASEVSATPHQPKVRPVVPIPIHPLHLLGDQYFSQFSPSRSTGNGILLVCPCNR